ncbi:MAG: hypothetical protein ACRC7C_06110 [Beijerinckiaceae bacterium]
MEDIQQPQATSPLNGCASTAAVVGQTFIEDEALSRKRFWVSPSMIARLLLARRIVRWRPEQGDYRRARILGLLIPEFDKIAMAEANSIATTGRPILPLYMRPCLLAGVAIVMRAGPEMLDLIQQKSMGTGRRRFEALTVETIGHWLNVRTESQRQLERFPFI